MGMKPEEPLGRCIKTTGGELPTVGYEQPGGILHNAAQLQLSTLVGCNPGKRDGGRLTRL
jgi:hypothetical protein